jgi:hypothetical protein
MLPASGTTRSFGRRPVRGMARVLERPGRDQRSLRRHRRRSRGVPLHRNEGRGAERQCQHQRKQDGAQSVERHDGLRGVRSEANLTTARLPHPSSSRDRRMVPEHGQRPAEYAQFTGEKRGKVECIFTGCRRLASTAGKPGLAWSRHQGVRHATHRDHRLHHLRLHSGGMDGVRTRALRPSLRDGEHAATILSPLCTAVHPARPPRTTLKRRGAASGRSGGGGVRRSGK